MKSPRSHQLALLVPCFLLFVVKPTATPGKAGAMAAEPQAQPAQTASAYTHIPSAIWREVIQNVIASHNGAQPDKIIPANASIATADTLVWGTGTNAQYFVQDKQKTTSLESGRNLELFFSYKDSTQFKTAYAALVKNASANGYKVKDSLRKFTVSDGIHAPYTISVGSIYKVYKVTRPTNVKGKVYVASAESEIVCGVIHNPNY